MPTCPIHYPTFGSPMPARQYSDPNSKYKFGFNGKEKDNEINVNGGDYDFGARIYDSRLGRWLSLDPLMRKYADLSPYNFCNSNPIFFLDIDGKDFIRTIDFKNRKINAEAVIYVKKGDALALNCANNAASFWNDQKYEVKTIEKKIYTFPNATPLVLKQTVNWKIKYSIKVIEVDDINAALIANPHGNSMEVVGDKDDKLKSDEDADGNKTYAAAKAFEHNKIAVSNKSATNPITNKTTPAHELGHLLGFGHTIDGYLMEREEDDMFFSSGIIPSWQIAKSLGLGLNNNKTVEKAEEVSLPPYQSMISYEEDSNLSYPADDIIKNMIENGVVTKCE